MEPEAIMLSEINQRKTNTVWSPLLVEFKQNKPTKLRDTKNRLEVASGKMYGVGEMGEGGQQVKTSSYKSWGYNGEHGKL